MEINCIQQNDLFDEFDNKYLIDGNTLNEIAAIDQGIREIGIDKPFLSDFWSEGDWTSTLEGLRQRSSNEYVSIISRHQKILKTRERFRPFIEEERSVNPIYESLQFLSEIILENGTYSGLSLIPVSIGISGTYFVIDKNCVPQFVVKPLDEEAGCINNPKSWAGVTETNPIRQDVPLYYSAMREALAYRVALNIGVENVAPRTALVIIKADQFHDYGDDLEDVEKVGYLDACGPIDREKLCSIQQFVPDARMLVDVLDELDRFDLNDTRGLPILDQSDFEDANILLWVTGDTDGHFGNFLVYCKEVSASGDIIYGIKKVDNGLTFPEKNRDFKNLLCYLDNAKQPLSDYAKNKIKQIDVDMLVAELKVYGLESSAPALRDRVAFLKSVINLPGITIKGVNKSISRS